jgi:two-component system, OmpR family, KDP operon response regulator KdpE
MERGNTQGLNMADTTHKIVIIDDEASIRRFLKVSLEAHHYQVYEAVTGAAGEQEVIARRPDIILLDLGLPDVSGIEVLKRLREWSKTPIIVLTVKDLEEQKVEALDLGADDYVTKPFSVPELLARIRVAIRHATVPQDEPIFRSGPLEIDKAAHVVRLNGNEIKLSATEYDLLKVLAQHAGKVVTHRMLLQAVWGPNSTDHKQYLRVYVGQLRKRLRSGRDSVELIRTESGVGYRLLLLEEEK